MASCDGYCEVCCDAWDVESEMFLRCSCEGCCDGSDISICEISVIVLATDHTMDLMPEFAKALVMAPVRLTCDESDEGICDGFWLLQWVGIEGSWDASQVGFVSFQRWLLSRFIVGADVGI